MRGLERGLERAIGNIRVAAYVEIETFLIYNLVSQMEQGLVAAAPVWTNLKTFPAANFHKKVHGIIGGYPCQPFSVAGKKLGEKDPRHLWPFIKSHIEKIRPGWCFFENVPGHINQGFKAVRKELEQMGYRLEAGIYSADEVGAPHRRERLFFLAILADAACFGSNNRNSEKQTWQDKISTIHPDHCTRTKWPALPEEEPFFWEEARLESSMGCTVNGYNFREDLLRMYGNGVVEQVAELAFRDLFGKHFKTNANGILNQPEGRCRK
jgi:site-specific DNA-cytosine methylase